LRLSIAVVILLTACGSGASYDAPTIVSEMRDAGIPLDDPALSDASMAITATDLADVRINVYGSRDEANEERLALIDSSGGPGLTMAMCGPVLVTFSGAPDNDAQMVEYRETAQTVLSEMVGDC
jgi:hypothetical protein